LKHITHPCYDVLPVKRVIAGVKSVKFQETTEFQCNFLFSVWLRKQFPLGVFNIMFLRYNLPFTWDPSLGRSNPSPTFLIFFSIFLSPVTSVTIFHDTSSSLILVKLESGGRTPSGSVIIFEFWLCPSASYVLILLHGSNHGNTCMFHLK